MTVRIRRVGESDASSVFTLASHLATSFSVGSEDFGRAFCSLLADSDAVILVAESEGAVVGYVLGFSHYTFYANERVAWVEEILVDERLRRENIGSSLMRAFEEWARTRECKLIALATRRAAQFYKAIGFDESATYFRKLL